MASSSFAWLSVVVKQGLTTLVPRKVVKADWEDNFDQLLTIVEPGFEGKVVDKILISPNERFADPAHQVEITAPLLVCDTLRCRFECIFLQAPATALSTTIETQYYSATLVSFPPVCYYCGCGEESLVCYYCGCGEESLVVDEDTQKLKEQYAVVRPLCFLCKSEGKTHFVRMPTNIRKRPRLS